MPKQQQHLNELSRYRYDVILHINSEKPSIPKIQWLNWQQNQFQLSSLQDYLHQNKPDIIGISQIPNIRTNLDCQRWDLLQNENSHGQTIQQFIEKTKSASESVDPNDIWQLSEKSAYTVEIDWSQSEAHGEFDAIFIAKEQVSEHQCLDIPSIPRPTAHPLLNRDLSAYANHHLQSKTSTKLEPLIKQHLKEKLPTYMMPAQFIFLEHFPLTSNGKIDKIALIKLNTQKQLINNYVAPRNETEQQLARIFCDLLTIEKISIYDNFFTLGGHSLLVIQAVHRIRKQHLVPKRPLWPPNGKVTKVNSQGPPP